MSAVEPSEAHLRLLRNLEAGRQGRDAFHGFVIEQNGLKAFWQCLMNGWVDRGALTAAGREVLKAHPVVPQRVACAVVSATPNPPLLRAPVPLDDDTTTIEDDELGKLT